MNFNPQRFEDFIREESFVRWVRNSDDESGVFWQQWCLLHPEFAKDVQLATHTLLSIGYKNSYELTPDELSEMFAQITQSCCDKLQKDSQNTQS